MDRIMETPSGDARVTEQPSHFSNKLGGLTTGCSCGLISGSRFRQAVLSKIRE